MRLWFALFISIYTANSFAKEIKFHEPKTETEKALDEILRVKDGLEKGKTQNEDITTRAFRMDEDRQQDEYRKSHNNCIDDDLCDFYGADHILCTNGSLTNIGFLYYTIAEDQGTNYILLLPLGYNNQPKYYYDGKSEFEWKDFTSKSFRRYIMKKEYEEWKIDGISCGSLSINFNIIK